MHQAEGTWRLFCVVEELVEGLVSLTGSLNSALLFYQLKHWEGISW